VSLRTSDHHGTELKVMHDLWGTLIESLGEREDAMWYALLDAADEFQACCFNSLCGYYRVAAACLRSALDVSTMGAFLQVTGSKDDLHGWLEGRTKLSFRKACDSLHSHARVRPLEDYLTKNTPHSIFEQKQGASEGGWIRILWSRLSDFSHSRPTHTAAKTWGGSNGPIYVTKSFGNAYALYLETMVLIYVLTKLARPDFELPDKARNILQSPRARPGKVPTLAFQFLWGR
jgi:hypothetical protein